MSVEQTLLVSRQVRWLARATDEVEVVLQEMRETELMRSVVVDRVAADLGMDAGSSLKDIAATAPQPWNEIFEEHRLAFLALTDEVQTVAAGNKELLGREQRATQQLLDDLVGDRRGPNDQYGSTYAPAGAIVLDQAF